MSSDEDRYRPTSKAPSLFYQGTIRSTKIGQRLTYKSLLERDAILLLETDPLVRDYGAWLAPLAWSDGLTTFRDVVPFRFLHAERGAFLLQVTVEKVADPHEPLAVARAARREAAASNVHRQKAVRDLKFDGIEVWTDKYMRNGTRLSDAEALYFHRSRQAASSEITAVRYALRRLGSVATIGALREASGLGVAARGVILELLARHELRREEAAQALDDACLLGFAQ